MSWILLVAFFGVAQAQPLYFRPAQKISEAERGIISTTWSKTSPAVEIVDCPDSTVCPDGTTCCKMVALGKYYCCPYSNAACCLAGGCCPQGKTCGKSPGQCIGGDWLTDILRNYQRKQLTNIVCPDGQSQCPDGNTCCKLLSGGYGCCPYPNAVCCSDGKHCCPHGSTCDLSVGRCVQQKQLLDWENNNSALELKNVVCPGGQYYCPDGTVCCRRPSGGFGCCPNAYPVCCSDGLHCCPSGTICVVSTGQCFGEDQQLDWAEKAPAIQLKRVPCPGGQYYCQDSQTCCKIPSGGYGCCTSAYPVCCSDGLHCCPQGYTCDSTSRICQLGGLRLQSAEKTPAKLLWAENAPAKLQWAENAPAKQQSNVVCPDRRTPCPDGSSCCKIPLGSYGCCPRDYPVCCVDGVHCCPQGYKCDATSRSCTKDGLKIDWLEKSPAEQLQIVVCPDASTCPDGNTCCLSASGGYGCCPISSAVCCSDGIHCCPPGTTCGSGGVCYRGDTEMKAAQLALYKP